MAEKDLEETRKLTPEERIRRLREIARRDEEEIKKAQDLIKESKAEIEEESRKKRFPVPEQEEVNIGRLFNREELEQKIEAEPIKKAEEEEARRQYELQEIRYAPRQELVQNWEGIRNDIYQTIQEGESPTEQQMSKLDNIMYATQSKIRDGSYVRDARDIHEAAKRLRDKYKG